jgi:hypothetical protein
MSKTIKLELNVESFLSAISGFPNPDDDGPIGPLGPWIRQAALQALGRINVVALNPQPLPPLSGLASLAVSAISTAVTATQVAEFDGGKNKAGIIKQLVGDWDGDICPPPRKWPPRPKFPFGPYRGDFGEKGNPADYLQAAAVFHHAGSLVTDAGLQEGFKTLAASTLEKAFTAMG